MTKEKFEESLINSKWNNALKENDYSLYERDGSYLFLFSSFISDGKDSSTWKIDYESVKLTRSRKGWFEIELIDGRTITMVTEDDFEIGCMG